MPRVDEVLDKLLFAVFGGVDLREGPEPGVRSEYQIDTAARPFDLARLTVADLVDVLGV